MKSNILVVDDEPVARQSLSDILKLEGFIVSSVPNGQAAVEHIRTHAVDLMIVDLKMPGMDGLAATALLKQSPATAGIPVVALTAMAMKDDREKTRRAGCDAYIAKPLRYLELYEVVDGLLVKSGIAPGIRIGIEPS